MSLEWILPGNIKAGWNVVSRSSLLMVSLLFGNAICHPRIFRDSNKSMESNTIVRVIATESYCRSNESKKKTSFYTVQREPSSVRSISFLSHLIARVTLGVRKRWLLRCTMDVRISCDGINLRQDNKAKGRIINGPSRHVPKEHRSRWQSLRDNLI